MIAIDGYSACGKSSTAMQVANRLNYLYIDSGAMYRAVTLYFQSHYVNLTNIKAINKALANIQLDFMPGAKSDVNETFLNGLNVEEQIRSMEVSNKVSEVSALVDVRKALIEQQRKMGKNKAVVMDGRDIGTHVFPEAELKIFMQAEFKIRAARRQKELLERGELINLEEVKKNLAHRDLIDTTRTENPLSKASDAHLIDTSYMTMEEQIDKILHLARAIIEH